MNNFKICLNNHFVFNGFIVQPGMIYGIDADGNSIITNGKVSKQGYFIYTNAKSLDATFVKIHITETLQPQIYVKIQKALRQREKKGITNTEYRTPMQLEMERWKSDEAKRHYKSACTPVGHTPKIREGKTPEAAAKYKAMKERNILTQRLNICKYNVPNGSVVII